jgi:hypothetical protein
MLSNKQNIAIIIPPVSILVGLIFCNPVVGMAINRIGTIGYSAYFVGGYTGYYTSNKLVRYYSNNAEKYYSLIDTFNSDSNYFYLLPKYNFNIFLKEGITEKESKKIIYTIIKHIINKQEHPLGIFYRQLLSLFKKCKYGVNDTNIINDCQRILLIMDFIFQKIYFQIESEYYQQWSDYKVISKKMKKKCCNILEISNQLVNKEYSALFHRYLQEVIMNDLYPDIIGFYQYVFEKEEKEVESKVRFYKYLPMEDLPFDLSKEVDLVNIKQINKLFKIFSKMKTGYRKLKVITKIQEIISDKYYKKYNKTGGADELFPILFYVYTISNLKNPFSELMFLIDFHKYDNLTGINGYCLTNYVAVISLIRKNDLILN